MSEGKSSVSAGISNPNDILGRLNLFFEKVTQAIAEEAKRVGESRGLEYPDDVFASITALLYCPIKWELAQEYPEEEREFTVAIQEGFFWEELAKKAISSVRKGKGVEIEPLITAEVKGKKIAGHPDVVLKGKQTDVIIELKSPVFTHFSPDVYIPSNRLVVTDLPNVDVARHYLWQSQLQQWMYTKSTGRNCIGVIFARTYTKHYGKYRRVFFVRYVPQELKDEDVEALVEAFENSKAPRYKWECSCCFWKFRGKCPGKRVEPLPLDDPVPQDAVLEEMLATVSRIYSLKAEIERLEDYLKRLIPEGQHYTVDGKVLGWVEREWKEWDIEKLVEDLYKRDPKLLAKFFKLNYKAINELEQLLGEEVTKYYKPKQYNSFVLLMPVDKVKGLIQARKADMTEGNANTANNANKPNKTAVSAKRP